MKKLLFIFCLAGVGYTSVQACGFDVVPVNATCYGANNGAIYAWATSGTGPYSYSIGGAFQSSGTFTGLAPGNYTLTCKATNCMISYPVTISQPSAISISTSTIPVSCNGGNNGSITVTASGGTPDYYLYSLNGGFFQGSNTFNGRFAGTYTITVKDYNGCTNQVNNVNITQPSAISISASTSNVTVHGGSDGSITVNASGGTPPFIYSIGGGYQGSNTFNGLSAGSYTITVMDANGCSNQAYTYIYQPSTIAFSTYEGAPGTVSELSLYPNPAQDQLNIQLESGITEGMNLQIVNAMGQVVHTQHAMEGRSVIDVSSLPVGTYILHLSGKGEQHKKVFVIQR